MQRQDWSKAIAASADPQRARNYIDQLQDANPASLKKSSPEQARILCALLSGSQAAGEWILAHLDWLEFWRAEGSFDYPRQEQGLRRDVDSFLKPSLAAGDHEPALAKLREFKQREMVRIAA